jgi:hypothetical protein
MTNAPPDTRETPAKKTRETRLKAALRANLARRKAQAKARRAGDAAPPEPDDTGRGGNND